jgi:hypothetical protein
MASTKISRAFSTATNAKKFTLSVWIKRSKLDSEQQIFSRSAGQAQLYINSGNKLQFYDQTSGHNFRTNRLFRDVNAWYHIVVAVDTTQSTASNRNKIYINGEQETSFEVETNATQNNDTAYNISGITYDIGAYNNAYYWDGYMSHFHFIDGTMYTASPFGETDATTGEWKINADPSVSYGNNGFFILKDGNSATDQSGNSNNGTISGTLTKSEDCPSNVFATMNPIDSYWMSATYSNGNNKVVTQGSHRTSMAATLGASSGKYYWEVKVDENTGLIMIGIDTKGASTCSTFSSGQCLEYTGQRTYGWGYDSSNGQIYNNDSSASYGNTYTVNDIIGIALDLDNNKLYFSKNGTWQNSGVPTSGSTGTGAVSITAPSSTDTGVYFPACSDTSSSASVTYSMNFGNGYFGTTAVTSAQNPDDGIGIFEYDVPAGYRALCTKSLNAQEYS